MADFRATENSSLKCVLVPEIRMCSKNVGDMSIEHRSLLNPVPTTGQFGNNFSIKIDNDSNGL